MEAPQEGLRFTKAFAADYSSSGSESEDEHLMPGVDAEENDFADFNPRKRRRLGGNNKERAALGIFASDSEDDGPGKGWKRKTLRNKGMSFVTNSTQQNGEDEEDSESDTPMLENGGSASDSEQPRPRTVFDGKNPLGRGFVPSSAYEPVLNDTARANAATKPPAVAQPSAFGAKGKVNAKSFGARMMAKMGYVEGKGLGKEGQGRNIIIEANLRPQGVGLGAVKEKSEQERKEEKRQAEMRGETVVDSDEEEKKKRRNAKKKKTLGGAFDSAGSTPRRQKTKYLTAEELKASAPGLHIPEAFAPILDMTGPGRQLLTSTSGIMTPTSGVTESAEVVEARKLVKRAQADLVAFSEEWRSLEARKTWVNLELKEKEQELDNLRSDFDRLQLFANMVGEQLASATDWNQVVGCLKQAVQLGSATTEIADIAVAAMHPFFRDSDWDPLTEPSRFASDMKDMAGFLMKSGNDARAVGRWDSAAAEEDGVYRRHHKATTPYESMMYKNWLPQVLAAIRAWDPLDPTPMLNVMESWNDLLPPFVRAQVMDNIARRLDTAVSDWNPKKKRQSHHLPHTWLFPWLQYLPPYHLDPRGTGLVADVRRKFRQLIDVWEFERGVVPGLAQWEDIMGDQWRPLLMSHVLPSMGRYLRANFRVDPADQEPYLPILTGVLKWTGILGETIVGEVLVQNMFPTWDSKLKEWMQLDEVNLEEVAEWYRWWRGVVLQEFGDTKGVNHELDKGLLLINMV
ncbi:GC-rich sequence DNA-binding factor-like protein-domain-containing protein [Stachybotrys elegans]|uniref:GC-rich sequence DNA-binding factor-like protein-domain-containing protein n=1 Tax=Stachybotrys elegans TaxID=80388 RepID=A0A8K0SN52_9HYPO|nr:GC-rich sequence DNA-binding factor-like protein-domain-containing protein [Stachybotrys elegans]